MFANLTLAIICVGSDTLGTAFSGKMGVADVGLNKKGISDANVA